MYTSSISITPAICEDDFSLWDKKFITLPEDSLAVSCALYRIYRGKQYYDMDTSCKLVEQRDRDLAITISEFYEQRMIIKRLTDIHYTDFETSMLSYLMGNRNSYCREQLGMIYRLPEFYEYDQTVIDIGKRYFSNSRLLKGEKNLPRHGDKIRTVVRLMAKTYRKVRHRDVTEFWCKNEHNYPTLLSVDRTNHLGNIVDYLFENHKYLQIEAQFKITTKNGITYLNGDTKWTPVLQIK